MKHTQKVMEFLSDGAVWIIRDSRLGNWSSPANRALARTIADEAARRRAAGKDDLVGMVRPRKPDEWPVNEAAVESQAANMTDAVKIAV